VWSLQTKKCLVNNELQTGQLWRFSGMGTEQIKKLWLRANERFKQKSPKTPGLKAQNSGQSKGTVAI
jgi:hypothetical protein